MQRNHNVSPHVLGASIHHRYSKRYQQQRGQSLGEVVVVIGIVVLLVTGLVAGSTVALRSSRFARSKSQGTKFAQEAVEILRNTRDNGWGTFFQAFVGTTGKRICLKDGTTYEEIPGSSTTCQPQYELGNGFKRIVTTSWDGQLVTVDVIVSWRDGTVDHSSVLKTYFSQWR